MLLSISTYARSHFFQSSSFSSFSWKSNESKFWNFFRQIAAGPKLEMDAVKSLKNLELTKDKNKLDNLQLELRKRQFLLQMLDKTKKLRKRVDVSLKTAEAHVEARKEKMTRSQQSNVEIAIPDSVALRKMNGYSEPGTSKIESSILRTNHSNGRRTSYLSTTEEEEIVRGKNEKLCLRKCVYYNLED